MENKIEISGTGNYRRGRIAKYQTIKETYLWMPSLSGTAIPLKVLLLMMPSAWPVAILYVQSLCYGEDLV